MATSTLVLLMSTGFAMVDADAATVTSADTKVASMLKQLTTEEKIRFTRGDGGTYMIPQQTTLGLGGLVSYDSAMGIRLDGGVIYGAQYPSPMALAASWSINRSKQYGLAIGHEERYAGGEFLLSPGVNLFRSPYGGRASEYMSGEDPFLGSVLAAAVVNGVQRQGVGAVAKHFVANDQEANRMNIDETIDQRTLHELYLPAFESMVKNSDVAGVMCAFNQVNGHYGCENRHLLTDVLRNQWGFKGFVVSDYDAIHDARLAARAGTDIDNPNGKYFTVAKITPLLESGDVTAAMLNAKVRHNLHAYVDYGFDTAPNDPQTLDDTRYGAKAALAIARESAVLLRNQRKANGKRILPLSKDAKIAVIGSIANRVPGSPFGTSYSMPSSYVTELSGLQQLATTPSDVDYIEEMELDPATSVWYQAGTSKITNSGLKAEYFSNSTLSGTATLTQVEPGVNFNWSTATNTTSASTTDLSSVDTTAGAFSLRLTGKIKPTISGKQVFKVRADGAVKLWVNGELILDKTNAPLTTGMQNAYTYSAETSALEAGKGYSVKLEYRRNYSGFRKTLGSIRGLQMSWASLTPPSDLSDYDAVVVSAGSTGFEYEGEGSDHDYAMPEYQADMITAVAKANPRTIVVLHGGGSMDMLPWYDEVKATLDTWFPGQQAGQALAEILYGTVNPSGKLPITIDKEISDNASYASYPKISWYQGSSRKKKMTYSEGLYMGYRSYDKDGTTPLYPFGYGLSYTTFEFSGLSLNTNVATASSTIKASFTLSNTGDTAGYEVAQLYVEPVDPTTERPVKELKGFSKVWLEPGQSKTVTIPINARALSYWRAKDETWVVDPGKYRILVGDSSASLPLSATVSALVQMTLSPKTSNPLPQPIKEAVQVSASRAY